MKYKDLFQQALDEDLVTYSSDGEGAFVPIEKVDDFIDFVLSEIKIPNVVPNKPYVGRVFRIKQCKRIYARIGDGRDYPCFIRSIFPESAMILDEKRGFLSIADNYGKIYWIKRSYFLKEVIT